MLCSPHYFKNVKMSALALLKMVMHARKGGNIEVMGLMQGKFEDGTFIVMDAFPLPVAGTEYVDTVGLCHTQTRAPSLALPLRPTAVHGLG